MSLAKRIVKLLDRFEEWEKDKGWSDCRWAHKPSGLELRFYGVDDWPPGPTSIPAEDYVFGIFDSWRLSRAFRRMVHRQRIKVVESGLGPVGTLPDRILKSLDKPLDWDIENGEWVHGPTGYKMSCNLALHEVHISAPQDYIIGGRVGKRLSRAFDALLEERKRARIEQMIEKAGPLDLAELNRKRAEMLEGTP